MTRKPSDIVQPNLRIREELRRRLEKEAAKRRVSLNQEMTYRLQRSLEEDAARTIDNIAGDIANVWDRFSAAHHKANMMGDLVRATETLLKQIEAGKPLEVAAAKVKSVIGMIDHHAAQAVRKMHTTGETTGEDQ